MTNRKPFLEENIDINKIVPFSYNVIVKYTKKPTKTEGGIILAGDTINIQNNAEKFAEIISIGEYAFKEYNIKPKVGDIIMTNRFTGDLIKEDEEAIYKSVVDTSILLLIQD